MLSALVTSHKLRFSFFLLHIHIFHSKNLPCWNIRFLGAANFFFFLRLRRRICQKKFYENQQQPTLLLSWASSKRLLLSNFSICILWSEILTLFSDFVFFVWSRLLSLFTCSLEGDFIKLTTFFQMIISTYLTVLVRLNCPDLSTLLSGHGVTGLDFWKEELDFDFPSQDLLESSLICNKVFTSRISWELSTPWLSIIQLVWWRTATCYTFQNCVHFIADLVVRLRALRFVLGELIIRYGPFADRFDICFNRIFSSLIRFFFPRSLCLLVSPRDRTRTHISIRWHGFPFWFFLIHCLESHFSIVAVAQVPRIWFIQFRISSPLKADRTSTMLRISCFCCFGVQNKIEVSDELPILFSLLLTLWRLLSSE